MHTPRNGQAQARRAVSDVFPVRPGASTVEGWPAVFSGGSPHRRESHAQVEDPTRRELLSGPGRKIIGGARGQKRAPRRPSVRETIQQLSAALRPGTALLLVERIHGAPARFLLDEPVSHAGRHPDAQIFLDDATVSARHTEIERRPDGFVLHDENSVNGTYLNGQRVTHAVLTAGDEIRIGKFRMRYVPARLGRERSPAEPGSHLVADANADPKRQVIGRVSAPTAGPRNLGLRRPQRPIARGAA